MSDLEQDSLAFDSERKHLGLVYAKALLAAAEKAEGVEASLEEFDAARYEVLDKLPQLDRFLQSPRVGVSEKVALIDKAFPGASATLRNFLKVVCQHERFDCLRVIHEAAHQLHDEAVGRVEVILTTAESVDDELRERIRQRLCDVLQKDVRIKSKVDGEILGGLMVRVGDTVYDGSLAQQLERVRRAALHHTMQEVRQTLGRFVVDA